MRKNFFPVFIAIIGFGLTVASCAKSNSTTPTTPATAVTQSFTASIGGNNWTAATIKATANSGYITIIGTAADGSSIQFTMQQSIAPGSSSIGPGTTNTLGYHSTATTNSAYTGIDGTLTITSNSGNVIKGSYANLDLENGNQAVPTIYATSGAFVAQY